MEKINTERAKQQINLLSKKVSREEAGHKGN